MGKLEAYKRYSNSYYECIESGDTGSVYSFVDKYYKLGYEFFKNIVLYKISSERPAQTAVMEKEDGAALLTESVKNRVKSKSNLSLYLEEKSERYLC